jgi:hypothetical protein
MAYRVTAEIFTDARDHSPLSSLKSGVLRTDEEKLKFVTTEQLHPPLRRTLVTLAYEMKSHGPDIDD